MGDFVFIFGGLIERAMDGQRDFNHEEHEGHGEKLRFHLRDLCELCGENSVPAIF
jgi:hypothetical protein